MPLINIAQAFTLHLEETGERILIKAGMQELEQKIADHFYVKANTVKEPPPPPGVDMLQPRLETEQALRNAQETLRQHNDAISATTAVDTAYRQALEASEARNADLQKKLDEHMKEAAAITQAQLTQSDTAHSGASSQLLVPTKDEKPPLPGVETGGETDDVKKARGDAEEKGMVVGKTDTGLPELDPEKIGKPEAEEKSGEKMDEAKAQKEKAEKEQAEQEKSEAGADDSGDDPDPATDGLADAVKRAKKVQK